MLFTQGLLLQHVRAKMRRLREADSAQLRFCAGEQMAPGVLRLQGESNVVFLLIKK